MPKHLLLIGIATLAAAALFAVTLLVETPDPAVPQRSGPAYDGPPDVAPYFDPDRVADTEGELASPELFQDVTHGQYRFRDEQRDTLLFYDRIQPKPHGVLEVEKPIAQVYFAVDQVLEIRADACTFIAPENQPRGGAFQGNVVVTLFETEDGSPVAFDNPDHIQLRTYLDEATFDLDLGQLESQSKVELTGRQIAFRGRGLSLIYNELRRRIERLEITEGEMLRFTPRRARADEPDEPDAADAGTPPADEASTPTAADTGAADDAEAAADAGEPEPEMFYRARFEREVRVTAEGGAVEIAADALEAVFTLRSDDWASTSAAPGGAGPTPYATAQAGGGARVVVDAAPPADVPAVPEAFHATADDADDADAARSVTIHWQGVMVLEPEFDPDPDLREPDDLLLRLVGEPARLNSGEGEQLVAREIEYLTSTGRVRATGTRHAPVHLVSAEMGEVQAMSLELDQASATGSLQGPGWLTNRAPASNGGDIGGTGEADEAGDDEPGDSLRVAWHDQLDLWFYRDAGVAGSVDRTQAGLQLAGLETARFHGNVEVNHAAFDLNAGQLALHMHPPADRRQALREIEASDGTQLRTTALAGAGRDNRGDSEGEDDTAEATIEAGALNVAFEFDGGNVSQPRRVTARESVVASHPQWRLMAGEVEVELADAGRDTATHAQADAQADAQANAGAADAMFSSAGNVRQLTAEHEVSLTLVEQGTELAGDRMLVNVLADEVELFGPDANPARLVRADATLAGPHITLAQRDRSVHVDGPGWLDAKLDPDEPDARLTVNWNERLTYDDTTGRAHVAGEVHSQSNTATNRTRLTADDLRFRLAAAEPAAPDAAPEAADKQGETSATVDAPPAAAAPLDAGFERRRITFATAEGDAAFLAESLDPATGERLSRIQLEGPVIHFDGDTELLTVPGAGRMVLTDTRPPDTTAADADASDTGPASSDTATPATADASPVNFTGRGVTVFFWQRQLTLDAGENTALFEQDVQMLHQPIGDGPHVQLDAQRLLGDFVATGGLANWTDGERADAQLNLVRADGNIRILHDGRTVLTDHLQYTAADQTVRLWAEAGGQVEVSTADQPSSLTAESLWWDLARDRFEARRPGPTIVPLPGETD